MHRCCWWFELQGGDGEERSRSRGSSSASLNQCCEFVVLGFRLQLVRMVMAAFQCPLWKSWAHTGFRSCGLCSVATPSRGVLSQNTVIVNPQTEVGGIACECFLVLLSWGRQENPLYSGTADNPESKKVVENVDADVVGPVTELCIVRNNSALFLSAWIECGWINVWSGTIESARETFRAGKTDLAGTGYATLVQCYVDHRCSLDTCHPQYDFPSIDTLLDWARVALNNDTLLDCPMCRLDAAEYLEGYCLCAANGRSEGCKLAWIVLGWRCPCRW